MTVGMPAVMNTSRSAECLEFRLSDKFVDTTTISEITSKTAKGPEMSEPVGMGPTTRRKVGNPSPEKDAWSK